MKHLKVFIIFSLILRGITPTFAGDSLSIEGFLSNKNLRAEKTREGIFYSMITEGAGQLPRQG